MHPIGLALKLSQWAIEATVLPPILLIFVIATISFLRVIWKQHPFGSTHWKTKYWYVLTQLLFFCPTIAVGVLCPAPLAGHPDQLGILCLNVLMYASFASGVFWVWRMKGLRWFAASVVALMEVPVLGALFIAGMSVTGDWL